MLTFRQLSGDYISDPSGNTTIGTRSSNNTIQPNSGKNLNSTAVGFGALRDSQNGKHNIAVGLNALANNNGGVNNIAIGENALYNYIDQSSAQFGNLNIAIGNNALRGNTGGTNNVVVGHNTTAYANNSILLGNGAVGATGREIGFGGLSTQWFGKTGPQFIDHFMQARFSNGVGNGRYYIPLLNEPAPFSTITDGQNYGDYLYWVPTGSTGSWKVGDTRINIGAHAGETGAPGQGDYAVALGNQAGQVGQNDDAVAIGNLAGSADQGTGAIAIGAQAGQTGQNAGAVSG